MLYTIPTEIRATFDNFGSTWTDAGLGTSAAGNTLANNKGTPVSLLSGGTVTEDVFGIGLIFVGGNASNSIRRYLVDLMYDPAGGTSWSVLIANLFVNNASIICGGYRYFFPLYVKSGTSFGFRIQSNLAGGVTLRCAIQLYGLPTRSENLLYGTRVETFGAAIGTTSGTAFTPGTSTLGNYTQVGTSANNLWWWQWGGIGYNESGFVANSMFGDVAAGDGTNMKVCIDNCQQNYTALEQAGKDAQGTRAPIRNVPSGTNIYCRAACSGTPETTPTTCAYGLG